VILSQWSHNNVKKYNNIKTQIIMKKSLFTIGLLSLVMILTSFTTPETKVTANNTTTVDQAGAGSTGGNVRLDQAGAGSTGGNVRLDQAGAGSTGGNVRLDQAGAGSTGGNVRLDQAGAGSTGGNVRLD
jgi:hypothetical protein